MLEIAEQPGNIGVLNAKSGVFHLDAKRVRVVLVRANLNCAAFVGELDGVRKIVVNYLLEPRGVGQHLAHAAGIDRDRNFFLFREYAQHIANLAKQGSDFDRLCAEIQLAGFYFSQVQYIID